MDAKAYAYLDRYAKLQPFSNFLLYSGNYSLTPLPLRRKRVLGFLLKKLMRFTYSAVEDTSVVSLCLNILNYLLLSYDTETHKVEGQLLSYLEEIILIIQSSTKNKNKSEDLINLFGNFLTQLSKKKQKYSNAFALISRVVGLMTLSNQISKIPLFISSQYTSSSDHMNNSRFQLLLSTFEVLPEQFQLKDYKEKIQKEKNITTDMILDLVSKQQDHQESSEDVLKTIEIYKKQFKGADSFLLKRKYFEIAYENGIQLEKEELQELLEADLFDLDYVKTVILYSEMFLDNSADFVLNAILKILEFNYANYYIWDKFVKLLKKQQEIQKDKGNSFGGKGGSKNDQKKGKLPSQENSMEQEDDEGMEEEQDEEEKENRIRELLPNEIEVIAKIQYFGKFKKRDLLILKKLKSQRKGKVIIPSKNNKESSSSSEESSNSEKYKYSNTELPSNNDGGEQNKSRIFKQMIESKIAAAKLLMNASKENNGYLSEYIQECIF